MINRIPPHLGIPPFVRKRHKRSVIIRRKGRISVKIVKLTVKGDIRRTIPSTRAMFERLEPITSPIARWIRPRLTAVTSNANSGSEVPIAIIFGTYQNGGGTPRIVAMADADHTANLVEMMTANMPMATFIKIIFLFFLFIVSPSISADGVFRVFVIM